MKTITKFIYAVFAVLILAIGALSANGAGKNGEGLATPRPRPTPAPRPTPPLTADVGSSYSNSKVPYAINRNAILSALGLGGYPPSLLLVLPTGTSTATGFQTLSLLSMRVATTP
jgi:hypothetical protein